MYVLCIHVPMHMSVEEDILFCLFSRYRVDFSLNLELDHQQASSSGLLVPSLPCGHRCMGPHLAYVGAGPCACAVSAVTHHAAFDLCNLFLACASAYFIFIPDPQYG